jgi:hypothetical protein
MVVKQMNTGLDFPTELFEKYLREAGVASLDSVNSITIDQVLLRAFADYKKEVLSLDLFSSICEKLLGRMVQLKEETSELGMILDYGEELSWYIRNDTAKTKQFLDEIERYVKGKV